MHHIAVLLKRLHNKTALKVEYLTSSETGQDSNWVGDNADMLPQEPDDRKTVSEMTVPFN